MSPAVRPNITKLLLWAVPLAALACGGDGGTDVVLPSLRITTATAGVEIDGDGYAVAIDGQAAQPIAVSATLIVERLADGAHTIELSGVAANCAVSGDNPRLVNTTSGSTAMGTFVVTCSASPGSIEVVTTTTGSGTDPDGFGLQLDGVDRGPMAVNASSTLSGLTPSTHIIGLTGVAPTCQVSGENPRSAQVPLGGSVQVAFAITCSLPAPTSGTIAVTTVTRGGGTDPDGYSLLLDGVDRGAVGINASSSLAGLTVGTHTIGITGLAANCQVSGENPRSIILAAGESVQVSFTVACSAPGPTSGTIAVTTATTGAGSDPDGYSVLLDGIDRGPIAVNASSNLTGLPGGSHTIGLTGLAANCQLSGENPRAVTVPAGGTVPVAFAIACTAPGAGTGSLAVTTITTGPSQDADGYLVSIDGSDNRPIGASATVTVGNISAGQHSVQLRGLASNCGVTGTNPLGVAIQAGETGRISFSVACVATVGSLRLTIDGLPANTDAAVTVTGPGNFSQLVKATGTLTALAPGSYTVIAADVVSGSTTYRPSIGRPSVAVTPGATATSTVSYTPAVVTPTLNLRIDGLYLSQSTQTYNSTVPLISGRDGYLRVFVVANETNSALPSVRVRLTSSQGSRTFNIPAPSPAPRQIDEGALGSSWNVPVPGSLIQSGLSIVAELDPADEVDESNEGDNRFPTSAAKSLAVRAVPAARIRFISVQQGAGTPGDVSNTDRLMRLARRMHPLNAVEVTVDPQVFPASASLEPGSDGNGWAQLLSDLDGKRVTEGTGQIYFGVVKLGYSRGQGLVGLTLGRGIPTAAGWDDAGDADRVVAHELGHVWNRRHSPCGNPPDVGSYPYSGGVIGVYGMDVANTDLRPRSTPDIMSYCFNDPWISDFTYREVMNFRAGNPFVVAGSTAPQPSLLLRGRVVNGRPILEPAFQIVTRPSLPTRPGPYSVTASALDGSQLLRLSFDVAVAEDAASGDGHFAFAVPFDQARALRLGSIRFDGPAGTASRLSEPVAQVRTAQAIGSIEVRREGNTVMLRWDASVYPMIMVRDPDTGDVLSFARGGSALVRTSKSQLDLEVSDGVRSQRRRVAINRS